MTKYMLLSGSSAGPIGPVFVRDPAMRKSRLCDGAVIGDTVVRDVGSAAKAFAEMMARRDFGKKAMAVGLKRNGIPAGVVGGIFSAHLGGENSDGAYHGREVRFAVTVKSDSDPIASGSA